MCECDSIEWWLCNYLSCNQWRKSLEGSSARKLKHHLLLHGLWLYQWYIVTSYQSCFTAACGLLLNRSFLWNVRTRTFSKRGKKRENGREREGRRGKMGGHHAVQPTQHVDGEGGGGAPNLTRVTPIWLKSDGGKVQTVLVRLCSHGKVTHTEHKHWLLGAWCNTGDGHCLSFLHSQGGRWAQNDCVLVVGSCWGRRGKQVDMREIKLITGRRNVKTYKLCNTPGERRDTCSSM